MSLAEQLQTTGPTRFVADHPWSFSNLEIIHLMALTAVFGMVLRDLRLPGLQRALPITLLQRHILPRVWIGLSMSLLMWCGALAGGHLIAYYYAF